MKAPAVYIAALSKCICDSSQHVRDDICKKKNLVNNEVSRVHYLTEYLL